MKLRPCIDIHNGKVKQIVGESLRDARDQAKENFVAENDAVWFGEYFNKYRLTGGHIILLNGKDSPYFETTKQAALSVLSAYPGAWQIGGGVNEQNAPSYIEAGASHVIVTSYVFHDGEPDMDRLHALVDSIGKHRLVLDLSCKRQGEDYYLVTDRWQRMTGIRVDIPLLEKFSAYCDEFLIHGADAEGKKAGIEEELVSMLGKWNGAKITYAGGIGNIEDIGKVKELGHTRLDLTIGSALSVFGGKLDIEEVLQAIE